jgi:hypothetical protein
LPEIGQELTASHEPCTLPVVGDDEIVERVAASLAVTPGQARRVVNDVIAFYREPLEDWVRRRHEQHRRDGLPNGEIYSVLVAEAADRVVAAPALTERQVRRIIYG